MMASENFKVPDVTFKSLIGTAAIVGFIGDLLLQVGSKYLKLGGPDGWGLKDYFTQHGSAESLFIAAGMMAIFYQIFFMFVKLPTIYVIPLLALYGIILDLIFRKFMVFKSLQGYYQYFNYFWSAVWAAIPLIIPFIIFRYYSDMPLFEGGIGDI
jgi:hypothetical protein